MMKKKTIFLGGEADKIDQIMPKNFEKFFTKRLLYFILFMMTLLLVTLL